MDKIFNSWLAADKERVCALADASDLLDVRYLDPQHILASFHCKGLVRAEDGVVREADHFEVGYWFNREYLRYVDERKAVSWLHPVEIFHPNVNPPFCCLGPIAPGTSLVDLLYRTYEVISYQNVMPAEDDALNLAACQWARHNQQRFPLDERPLKRRSHALRSAALELQA
jgi:hypothetical protein